jgi:malate synthase
VAHPGLVPVAKQVFDTHMGFQNQIDRIKTSTVTQADLLQTPTGAVTRKGISVNLDVGLRYLTAWLGGNGCVPIYNLMEDAATAEICRAQIWQWLRLRAPIDDGSRVTPEFMKEQLQTHVNALRGQAPERELTQACQLYEEMMTAPEFPEFLTLRAYDYLD